jgi:malate dehydrogenase (oxaloacetate-decarboxylating)(NADP+)
MTFLAMNRSAGMGVAAMLVQGMVQQGLSEAEARKRFYICDKDGLLGQSRGSEAFDQLDPLALAFARADENSDSSGSGSDSGGVQDGMSLEATAAAVKPTVLLGLSAQGGLFTKELVATVQKAAEAEPGGGRAIIFPLSNPTARAECTAEQAYEWTGGECIFASGSPFAPFQTPDGKTFTPSQCNK